MHWDDLRVFLAVAREGGLTGGGRVLRLDPATAGRRVARLESELGAQLFTKGPQGYRLTEPGVRLLDHAERAQAVDVVEAVHLCVVQRLADGYVALERVDDRAFACWCA